MTIPLYFKQEKKFTCSLAVLRMVLAHFDIKKTEAELEKQIVADYGKNFTNLYNPTIAKLAIAYGVQTTMYALWPLFKKDNIKKAIEEFKEHPDTMNIGKYENPHDTDAIPEPLTVAYKDMFLAVEQGCKVVYGSLTEKRIKHSLNRGALIQTSIKLEKLYPQKQRAYHSILLYRYEGNTVFYHDPLYGEALHSTFTHLLKAAQNVGACMVYERK